MSEFLMGERLPPLWFGDALASCPDWQAEGARNVASAPRKLMS